MKKLEFEKNKPTFIISVLKVEYLVVLVSSISNFFSNKISMDKKKIPTWSKSALDEFSTFGMVSFEESFKKNLSTVIQKS